MLTQLKTMGAVAGSPQTPLVPADVTSDSFVGSYVAVGTFKPDIEIWNLDVLDPLEPSLVLRGKEKEKQAKKAAAPSGGHSDAVMGLSWNRAHRHLIASASADRTAKIWDLDADGKMLHTFSHHSGKVQAVQWSPVEASILATASYDRTLAVLDARQADKARVARYALPADSECMSWDAHNPACLIASCEDGTLLSYDCRRPDKALWSVRAHASSCTSFSQSLLARGLLATSSLDKTVKVWDTLSGTGAAGAPVCIAYKSMNIGQVFGCSFFPHSPFLLGAGGSKGMVALWDITQDAGEVTAAGATAPAAAESPNSSLYTLPEDASVTARRFAGRIVSDASAVPGLSVRSRFDGQPVA
jgi:periodic tryptophan protein 1